MPDAQNVPETCRLLSSPRGGQRGHLGSHRVVAVRQEETRFLGSGVQQRRPVKPGVSRRNQTEP